MAIKHNPAHTITPILLTEEHTVASEIPVTADQERTYQTEAQLEAQLIATLQGQAYDYLPLHTADDLKNNLRTQLEKLNNYQLTDTEWERFYTTVVANPTASHTDKTEIIQREPIQPCVLDDGTIKNFKLIDRRDIHNNTLQVINQYVTDGGAAPNRYDVTILVNGLPLVHLELKRRGVEIQEAFNQIRRYQKDSFWADTGLYDYIQIFVISNGTRTKYYSNTVRYKHVDSQRSQRRRRQASADSFEFTSWWATDNNKRISDLIPFAKTFFARHTLLNILTRYCVFTVDKDLLVMRPYQIVATEKILRKILIATNYKKQGTIDAGGYIWHTTGSGKTLTSFKTAQLAKDLDTVHKVIFVVDRKDLDYQTMKEYDAFQKGAANSNTSTKILKGQLEDPGAQIIITTIQKLDQFIKKNPGHPIFAEPVVLIFDECHRSQFGDMHTAITRNFKKYFMFGFTGTPIFDANAKKSGNIKLRTTQDAFGEKLHTYTIVDAIGDKNVLPFRVEYNNSVKQAEKVDDAEVYSIATEAAMRSPERIKPIVRYILDHYDQKTKRNETYQLKDKRLEGFNSILATASIDAAKVYYNAFQTEQQQRLEEHGIEPLKVAIIYSAAPHNDDTDDFLAEESLNPSELDMGSFMFLQDAVSDYNQMFNRSFDLSGDGFDRYYKDVSKKMKNRELDLLIVVNMFLTGFDSKTINTLWVDKNMKSHGLIQAFSRTNRILNSVKTYGNIVCFRNLETETDEALALFGNKDARATVLLKPYADYLETYREKLDQLNKDFSLERLSSGELGEQAQKEFVKLFGEVLKLRNILSAFDEFEADDTLAPRDVQDYQSHYLDIYRTMRDLSENNPVDITEDLIFEIELIKQVSVGVDHILMLVKQYQQSNGTDEEVRSQINRAIDSSPTLHNKKDLIEDFLNKVSFDEDDVQGEWKRHIQEQSSAELDKIIEEEKLNPEPTRAFMADAWTSGELPVHGERIGRLMKATGSRFAKPAHGESRATRKERLIKRLQRFYERFSEIIS
ncbi:type I restriction endonuclease subunit R [Rothia nasimurium]|uniref:type I restriction endonuclease subunit R n=1 Tax=Rothia nasimurium TaxID=85336 RepID=UPI001F2C4672|nr:type I restriction endonuclease subunit R [Rothia nasimurium]